MEPKNLHNHYRMVLGEEELFCEFTFPETARYFGDWCTGPLDGNGAVRISDWFWQKVSANIGPRSPYIEFTAFSSAASVALLDSDRFLMHAVAFRWNNQAWLVTGPPGTGKSTHMRMLREQYDNEFTVICGDRPVLERSKDGSFFVHPSPWNGGMAWRRWRHSRWDHLSEERGLKPDLRTDRKGSCPASFHFNHSNWRT